MDDDQLESLKADIAHLRTIGVHILEEVADLKAGSAAFETMFVAFYASVHGQPAADELVAKGYAHLIQLRNIHAEVRQAWLHAHTPKPPPPPTDEAYWDRAPR